VGASPEVGGLQCVTMADNPNFGGGVDLRLLFHKAEARWEHRFSDRLENQAILGFGIESGEGDLGEQIRFKLDELPLHFRDELTFDTKSGIVFRTGVDGVLGWSKWHFRAPEVFPQEGSEWDPIGANTRYIEDEGEGMLN